MSLGSAAFESFTVLFSMLYKCGSKLCDQQTRLRSGCRAVSNLLMIAALECKVDSVNNMQSIFCNKPLRQYMNRRYVFLMEKRTTLFSSIIRLEQSMAVQLAHSTIESLPRGAQWCWGDPSQRGGKADRVRSTFLMPRFRSHLLGSVHQAGASLSLFVVALLLLVLKTRGECFIRPTRSNKALPFFYSMITLFDSPVVSCAGTDKCDP